MKTKKILVFFTILTFLYSCGSQQEENQFYGESSVSEVVLSPPPAIDKMEITSSTNKGEDKEIDVEDIGNDIYSKKSIINKKKIIKDGNISVKTNDINASKKGINDLLKKLNAYFESEDLQNNDQSISYNLKIRVPAENFEKLISTLENGEDEIKSKSIQAREVTEEYVDIGTRLKNKREYLKKYKELLFKASTIKDILAIEENVRTLQEEIESKEGRLKYLNDQISFSTLNLNIYKEKEFVYKPQIQDKFSERAKTSLSRGWISVVELVLWTITIWPFILLILVAIILIRRVIKRRKTVR